MWSFLTIVNVPHELTIAWLIHQPLSILSIHQYSRIEGLCIKMANILSLEMAHVSVKPVSDEVVVKLKTVCKTLLTTDSAEPNGPQEYSLV